HIRKKHYLVFVSCFLIGSQATDLKLSSSVRQERHFVSVKAGENLTLQCDVAVMLYWYKQTLGQKPKLISTYHKYNINGIFHDEFKNNSRFTLDMENGKNHLKITDVRVSDSATYYCASSYTYIFEFAEGTVVNVEGSGMKVPATVHQSASESIQPGGSVTLNCTVHTGTCDGEHSVYWFKNSEESQPGLIYTHGDRNDQCERKPNTQTHTCVYKLPMKSLNLSHAGTYYCAVASCGHILFGDGTKLELESKEPSAKVTHFYCTMHRFLDIVLFSVKDKIMIVRYIFCYQGYQHSENLYYAALSADLSNRSRGQRDPTWSECVYYSVKQ
uniref:Ig-like domain-containing protein n=1 Tax=Sander lucioperca TaxID=283035 RepID=A0A8D0CNZ7_SANLU